MTENKRIAGATELEIEEQRIVEEDRISVISGDTNSSAICFQQPLELFYGQLDNSHLYHHHHHHQYERQKQVSLMSLESATWASLLQVVDTPALQTDHLFPPFANDA